MIEVTSKNFNEYKDKPLVLDFYADWCAPCKVLAPVLEQVAGEYPDVVFAKCNVEADEDFASEYNVRNVPTVIMFKDGEQVSRFSGAFNKAKLVDLINTYVV